MDTKAITTINCQDAICIPPVKVHYSYIYVFIAGGIFASFVGGVLINLVGVFRKAAPEVANSTNVDDVLLKIGSFLKFGLDGAQNLAPQDLADLIKVKPEIVQQLAARNDTKNLAGYLKEQIEQLHLKP
jgi:hypothetical protein